MRIRRALSTVIISSVSWPSRSFHHFPKIDVYTGRLLEGRDYTKEHLIPKKFFRNKRHADHPFNIVPCHRRINNQRSSCKFGDLGLIFWRLQQQEETSPLYLHSMFPCTLLQDSDNITAGVLCKERRVFYPGCEADKGMIGRNCIMVMTEYPYLFDHFEDIVEDPMVFEVWKDISPMSEYEKSLRRVHGL